MSYEQVKAESDAVLAWIRARPKFHKEMMGYAQVAKHAPQERIRNIAQKRFEDMYAEACKQVGVKV